MDLKQISGSVDLRDWDFKLERSMDYIVGCAATYALREKFANKKPWAMLIGEFAFSDKPDDGEGGMPVHPLVIEISLGLLGEQAEGNGPVYRIDLRELVDWTIDNGEYSEFFPRLAADLLELAAHVDARLDRWRAEEAEEAARAAQALRK